VKSLRFMTSMLTLIALAGLLSSCGTGSTPTAPGSTVDSTPPPAPSELAQAPDVSGGQQLEWSASPAGDVAGYQVFAYDPSPDRDNAYVQIGETAAGVNHWTLPASSQAETQYYRVRAVDVAGNHSALSADFAAKIGPPGSVGTNPSGTDLPEPSTP
jgi:hypothetical protein